MNLSDDDIEDGEREDWIEDDDDDDENDEEDDTDYDEDEEEDDVEEELETPSGYEKYLRDILDPRD